MNDNMQDASHEIPVEVPEEVLSDPALLFLYYRIEQILGIKTKSEALKNLNEYMKKTCGSSFIENPASYEYLLTSREQIFSISKFLTVNETYFFREGIHFKLLSEFLPEMKKLKRPVQICSAASSIGCEAYSIAMLFDYLIKNGLDLDFTVDAFDVCNDAIETAKIARYTANTLRNDGAAWKYILDLYLIPDNDEYIVCKEIRKKVNFFPHNIMRGLEKQYDIIFFRNALIYFSTKNRHDVINNLAESLFPGGLLFLGISETSSIRHPLLASRFSLNNFYFQKAKNPDFFPQFEIIQKQPASVKDRHHSETSVTSSLSDSHCAAGDADRPSLFAAEKSSAAQPAKTTDHSPAVLPAKLTSDKKNEFPVNCPEIAEILKVEEGKQNAQNVLDLLMNEDTCSLSCTCLTAAVIYYLNKEDFENADKLLLFLETQNSQASTKFLRAEYFYLRSYTEEAEKYYQEAAVKDKYFWPAFYRIASLASEGNRTRYEYKIKKTIESIELSQNSPSPLNYECFMGGFSPDYFLRILEKKLI